MIKSLLAPEKGTWVLLSFIAFFGVVIAVNTVFITTALRTHSGVITEQPYEKGLAYDEILQTARAQPAVQQQVTFENSTLTWVLKDEANNPIDAIVTARLIRPVKDGYDFDIDLVKVENGVYESKLNLPMKGRWDAHLKAQWDNQSYQTHYPFVAK